MPGGPESPVLGGVEYQYPAAAWSQGGAPSGVANFVTAAFSQAQSLSLVTGIAHVLALAFTQAQALTESLQRGKAQALAFTQATTFTKRKDVAQTKTWSVAQTPLITRTRIVFLTVTQSVAYIAARPSRLVRMTVQQLTKTKLSRNIGSVRGWSQTQAVTDKLGTPNTKAVTVSQGSSLSLAFGTVYKVFNVVLSFVQPTKVYTPGDVSWSDTGIAGMTSGGVHKTPAAPDGSEAQGIGGRTT